MWRGSCYRSPSVWPCPMLTLPPSWPLAPQAWRHSGMPAERCGTAVSPCCRVCDSCSKACSSYFRCTSGSHPLLTCFHAHCLCQPINPTGCKDLSQQWYISRSTAVAAVFQAHAGGFTTICALGAAAESYCAWAGPEGHGCHQRGDWHPQQQVRGVLCLVVRSGHLLSACQSTPSLACC